MAKRKADGKGAKMKQTTIKINMPEEMTKWKCGKYTPKWRGCGGGGMFYGLGFLGSAVYYVSTATSFLGGVLGLVKAVFWPAFLVYGLLAFIGA